MQIDLDRGAVGRHHEWHRRHHRAAAHFLGKADLVGLREELREGLGAEVDHLADTIVVNQAIE